METERESIEERMFWLKIEELTLLLKKNHKEIVSSIRNNNREYNTKESKDVELLRLQLENLGYKLGEIIR